MGPKIKAECSHIWGSYFHVFTIVKRHRNKIRCIKDDRGEWIADEEGVKQHIIAGFEKLYTTGVEKASIASPISNFSCCYLTDEEQTWVGKGVTEEDVKEGLWALKPFKALGLDGLHAGFFQYFWFDFGNSVCLEVIPIFNGGVILEYLNDTLITLIPKC